MIHIAVLRLGPVAHTAIEIVANPLVGRQGPMNMTIKIGIVAVIKVAIGETAIGIGIGIEIGMIIPIGVNVIKAPMRATVKKEAIKASYVSRVGRY